MQHEAETKLDLRVPGKLSLGGAAAASHQTGPGPPSQSLNADVSLTNHVGPGQSVIKPLAPPPAKPSIEIRPTPSSVPQPPAPAPPERTPWPSSWSRASTAMTPGYWTLSSTGLTSHSLTTRSGGCLQRPYCRWSLSSRNICEAEEWCTPLMQSGSNLF